MSIGNDTYLVIKKIRWNKGIEMGIEAPPDVDIHREEFWRVILAIQKKINSRHDVVK